jgi:hypothetical protein
MFSWYSFQIIIIIIIITEGKIRATNYRKLLIETKCVKNAFCAAQNKRPCVELNEKKDLNVTMK